MKLDVFAMVGVWFCSVLYKNCDVVCFLFRYSGAWQWMG